MRRVFALVLATAMATAPAAAVTDDDLRAAGAARHPAGERPPEAEARVTVPQPEGVRRDAANVLQTKMKLLSVRSAAATPSTRIEADHAADTVST